jgi:hypothetical protein
MVWLFRVWPVAGPHAVQRELAGGPFVRLGGCSRACYKTRRGEDGLTGAEGTQRLGQATTRELRSQQRRAGGKQHRTAQSLERAEQLERQRGRGQRTAQ